MQVRKYHGNLVLSKLFGERIKRSAIGGRSNNLFSAIAT
jgi:hypothetical protein